MCVEGRTGQNQIPDSFILENKIAHKSGLVLALPTTKARILCLDSL